MRAVIILKSGKDKSVMRFHPWVFSGAIKKIKGNVSEGDIVDVYNNKEEFLGSGHYQPGSIAVRIFTFSEADVGHEFWKNKIQKAVDLRTALRISGTDHTNAYRLINAEGDGLPGLIADYYNGTLVVQMHSVGMYQMLNELANCFREVLGDKLTAIYNKSASTLPFKSAVTAENSYVWGESKSKLVVENGNQFIVDWEAGQKTGFFIDQRENRKLVEHFSKNRKVLNMFGYTGGFSVYAMRGGAELVHSVDSSKQAIELTNNNIQLNFPDQSMHEAYAEDAFDYLDKVKKVYDMIILDPPAFAKHQNVLHNALQGYKRLNYKAFEVINSGGLVFTFSCSQAVSKENFKKTVFTAAANSGRNIRILGQLNQPSDHPVSIYHPEGEYLKGLVLEVE